MNTLTSPRTNMEIADLINQRRPLNDAPYYSQEIHDYLIVKGAEFKQIKPYQLSYLFKINGEDVRLIFLTDIDKGSVKIQVWYEEDGDEHTLPYANWLTADMFTIPVGHEAFGRFKQILTAYIQSL